MRPEINHAVVMAAGRGMRMRPLTDDIPKAMAPIGESTLIASGIKKLKGSIKNVHITVGYKGAMLAKHVLEKDVSSVINTESKGNAWWIYNSLLNKLNEPLFVLTCDNIVDLDFKLLVDEYFEKQCPACMIIPVKPIPGIDGDYIIKDSSNNVVEISRTKVSSIYCSGIQIINPAKINLITENTENFNEVWNQLIFQRELICSERIPKKWISIDDINQLNLANTPVDSKK